MISRISDEAACWSSAPRRSAVSHRIVSSSVSRDTLGAGGSETIEALVAAERVKLTVLGVAAMSRDYPFCIVYIAADTHNRQLSNRRDGFLCTKELWTR
jgi:hypothetical protein